ncbi:hypothetical protein AB6Q56_06775 [Dechloromonas sp. ARDL1]|uniref:hypothetical protein n=1 Tax=Dechloromonas sp. ARDL1 TaxID=3322121 RepID=UPI003DA70B49
MSIYQTPAGKWRVQVGSGDNRKTKVFNTKREADRWQVEQEKEREGISPTTWGDLADDYFNSSRFFEKSEKTQPVEIKASNRLLKYFPILSTKQRV